MNTHVTASFENTPTNPVLLGNMIDSFIDIIARPKPASKGGAVGAFSELRRAFDATEGLQKSLLVLRVENEVSEGEEDVSALLVRQGSIVRQLEKTCGLNTHAAAIGDDEYAVLLLGVDQCSDLIPRIKNVLSRMAAGHLNGDGASLKCSVGVARCPVDTDDLSNLIRMASVAAAELIDNELGYQFISRRHHQN